MNFLAQNIVVAVVVGTCVASVGWQIARALRGQKSKLGSCCAKGCDATLKSQQAANPKQAAVQFMPLENLGRTPRRIK